MSDVRCPSALLTRKAIWRHTWQAEQRRRNGAVGCSQQNACSCMLCDEGDAAVRRHPITWEGFHFAPFHCSSDFIFKPFLLGPIHHACFSCIWSYFIRFTILDCMCSITNPVIYKLLHRWLISPEDVFFYIYAHETHIQRSHSFKAKKYTFRIYQCTNTIQSVQLAIMLVQKNDAEH